MQCPFGVKLRRPQSEQMSSGVQDLLIGRAPNAFVENVRALGEAGPPSSDRFCPAIGGQADINSASSDRLGPLGIPVHPASLIRLAGATFMIVGVVLIRT